MENIQKPLTLLFGLTARAAIYKPRRETEAQKFGLLQAMVYVSSSKEQPEHRKRSLRASRFHTGPLKKF
jgi:hypothetical protein